MAKALILKFPGTNCDQETAKALEGVGFEAQILPTALLEASSLDGVDLLVFAGGFSYGDYVQSGRFARLRIEEALGLERLQAFVDAGGYVLGICNGFQILTELGLLPEASLIENTSGRFQCRWVELKVNNPAVAALSKLPENFELPIAHAEGRLVAQHGRSEDYLATGQAALLYSEDVNGSQQQIAGLADESGRVFGLMPHPERFVSALQHYDPDWSERYKQTASWGHALFEGLYEAIVRES